MPACEFITMRPFERKGVMRIGVRRVRIRMLEGLRFVAFTCLPFAASDCLKPIATRTVLFMPPGSSQPLQPSRLTLLPNLGKGRSERLYSFSQTWERAGVRAATFMNQEI